MRIGSKLGLVLTLATLTFGSGHGDRLLAADDRLDSLDNGLKLILVENHGSPMIASVIFVQAGSKFESEYENGITHFLEHLLFDGTVNLTREELDNSIRDLGGYINAFTRKDLTAYMVLLPRQYIEQGLTVQADMLFNSTFPEEELAKERLVVIEEIKRANDRPGAPAEAFFTEKAYGSTDYGRPVLGYETLIAAIPREAVIDYWKRNYTPDKMTALVIGDFDSAAMRRTVADIFGRFPRPEAATRLAAADLHRRLAGAKGRARQVVGQHRYDTAAQVNSAHVDFSVAGPKWEAPDFMAFDLLAQYLAMDEVSPLKIALQGGADPPATEVTVALAAQSDFSRLDISIITEKPEECDRIVRQTLASLAEIPFHRVDSTALRGIKTTVRCEAVYNAEKLHYYGFRVAPMLMTAGWEWIRSYPDRLDSVTVEACRAAAAGWLSEPDYAVTVVRPSDSTATPYRASGPPAERVQAYFDVAEFPRYELSEGTELVYPKLDSVKLVLDDKAAYHREVLDNGLTVLVKSSRDSRVFAVNVLGRNRSANEPEGKAGITDFVNRCLEKGTSGRDAGQLARDLASIGANLTLYDNPWIPYDDRYTTRSFSFVKFETIERFAPEGLALLVELLTRPAFDAVEVENVRAEMMGTLGRSAGSPGEVARDLFYGKLFEGHPFARPIMGTTQSLASITVDDLWSYHKCFYSPRNMILSIVTSRDTAEVMAWVRSELAGLTNFCEPAASPEAPPPTPADGETYRSLETEQVAICAGGQLPGVASDDALNLQVTSAILSRRLFGILREKQGLAYATGAATNFDASFGWYLLTIGTGGANYRRALEGLKLQTEKLAFDGPTPAEVRGAVNQIWGRLMSARLSRLNQAYYLALDEFFGRELPFDRSLLERLTVVDVRSVREGAARYLQPKTWVIATAGRRD